MIIIGNRYGSKVTWDLEKCYGQTHDSALRTCGSVVDCSLVLFSIFGLSALHQEFFFLFPFIYIFFCGMGQGVVKSVPLWAI